MGKKVEQDGVNELLSRHQSDATEIVPIPETVPISSSIDERKLMIMIMML